MTTATPLALSVTVVAKATAKATAGLQQQWTRQWQRQRPRQLVDVAKEATAKAIVESKEEATVMAAV